MELGGVGVGEVGTRGTYPDSPTPALIGDDDWLTGLTDLLTGWPAGLGLDSQGPSTFLGAANPISARLRASISRGIRLAPSLETGPGAARPAKTTRDVASERMGHPRRQRSQVGAQAQAVAMQNAAPQLPSRRSRA